MKTFIQFLKEKDYNIYRNFRNDKLFSLQEMSDRVKEWEQGNRTHLKKLVNQMEKEE